MARQVYYDPMGSRLEGYRLGVNDEMGLQRNTRQARDTDLDYYNAQRETRLQDYADPYRRQAIGYGADIARNNAFQSNLQAAEIPATSLGVAQPYMQEILRRFNINAQPAAANPDVERARANYQQNLDATLNSGGLPDTPELRQQIAQQAASYYGIPAQYLLNPGMSGQPQQTDYYMNDPGTGQPTRVGGMADPNNAIINQLMSPEVMRYIQMQNQIENQRAMRDYRQGSLDYKYDYMDFAQGGYGVPRQDAGGFDPLPGL